MAEDPLYAAVTGGRRKGGRFGGGPASLASRSCLLGAVNDSRGAVVCAVSVLVGWRTLQAASEFFSVWALTGLARGPVKCGLAFAEVWPCR